MGDNEGSVAVLQLRSSRFNLCLSFHLVDLGIPVLNKECFSDSMLENNAFFSYTHTHTQIQIWVFFYPPIIFH